MHPAIARHIAGISDICQRYRIRRLEVFGSAARGDDFVPETSDADFLVEFAPDVQPDLHSIFGAKAELEQLLGRGVDLVEPGAVRNPYVLANINRHREPLYAAWYVRVPEEPQIVAFRHQLSHGYATVNPGAVWNLAQDALPGRPTGVQHLLEDLKWSVMFYLDLFRALDHHRVKYALIGGLAVALHGVERNTMDIDISVVMSPENLQHLIAAARALELTPMLPVPLETLADLDTLKQWHSQRNLQAFALRSNALAGVTLDVLLFPPVDAGALCERALRLDVTGVPVRLASVQDLIALKAAVGRPIDLADIEHLKRLPSA